MVASDGGLGGLGCALVCARLDMARVKLARLFRECGLAEMREISDAMAALVAAGFSGALIRAKLKSNNHERIYTSQK